MPPREPFAFPGGADSDLQYLLQPWALGKDGWVRCEAARRQRGLNYKSTMAFV